VALSFTDRTEESKPPTGQWGHSGVTEVSGVTCHWSNARMSLSRAEQSTVHVATSQVSSMCGQKA